MNPERNIGVTEAGLGLGLMLCVLVALGYLVLHKIGGTGGATPVEVRSESSEPSLTAPFPPEEQQPHVLTIESSEPPGHALRTPPIDSGLR